MQKWYHLHTPEPVNSLQPKDTGMNWQYPQHSEVEAWLDNMTSQISGAECHGLLVGYACGGHVLKEAEISSYLAPDMPESEAVEWYASLRELFNSVEMALNDAELEFQPLLPGDDEPIAVRRDALGLWCQGFLLGLSMGGVDRQQYMRGEVAEILNDLVAISQAGDYEVEEDEEDEQAYMELVEYIRTGVLLLYADFREVGVPTNDE
jgi:yecA family protein